MGGPGSSELAGGLALGDLPGLGAVESFMALVKAWTPPPYSGPPGRRLTREEAEAAFPGAAISPRYGEPRETANSRPGDVTLATHPWLAGGKGSNSQRLR